MSLELNIKDVVHTDQVKDWYNASKKLPKESKYSLEERVVALVNGIKNELPETYLVAVPQHPLIPYLNITKVKESPLEFYDCLQSLLALGFKPNLLKMIGVYVIAGITFVLPLLLGYYYNWPVLLTVLVQSAISLLLLLCYSLIKLFIEKVNKFMGMDVIQLLSYRKKDYSLFIEFMNAMALIVTEYLIELELE